MNLLVRRRTVIAARERAKKSKGLGIQHQQRTQQIKLYSRTALGACLQKTTYLLKLFRLASLQKHRNRQ